VASEGVTVPSIGRPIAGVEAYVVDENLQPVNSGDAGELVIGGVAVARGYLNRPELTAQRFVNNGRGRQYRTGDRVRLRPDGEFDFLGRLDDQLSIRGFRVEPGEVSAALNAHPAIAASVLVGVGTSSADRQLVAYVVASGSALPSRQELHQFLGAFLPEHLLPSRYIWLDEMPLTAHGKIDRDALPAPLGPVPSDRTGPETVSDNVTDAGADTDDPASLTSTEAVVAAVLAELLDVPEIGMHENFFLLGGHSMLGAQLIVRLESLFKVEISLRYLFDHPTLAEISAQVGREVAAGTAGSSATG
jgi:acyl carrier protein